MGSVRPASEYTRRTALTLVAALPVWAQTKTTNQGEGVKMAHPVIHFEIGCKDIEKTQHFFSSLFGWQMQSAGPAAMIPAEEAGGIPGHITALGHEPEHYTMFYVEVEDVQAYLDKATSLGGKVLVPPVKIPMGTFGWFSDPEGNMIGLLKKA